MKKWQKNLYAVWLTQFLSLLGFGFCLPFLPFFIQDLGIKDPVQLKVWVGWLNSGPSLALAVMAPVWGVLADRLGKKLMLIRAMIGGTVVLIGLGFAGSAWTVLIFRILQGLLTGTVTSSATLVASGTPDDKLSYALGFVSSSTFIGYSLGPAVGGLIAEQFGYQISFFIGAAIMFIGLLLVIFLIEEPTPEMAGHIAVGSAVPKSELKSRNSRKYKAGKLTITPYLVMLFILFFFIRLSRVMPSPFLPLFVQEIRGTIEGSARMTGLISGAIALASAASGLTLSRLGDRMNRMALMSVLLGIGTAVSLFITLIPGLRSFIIFAVLTFFLIGGVEPLIMAITSEQVSSENRGMLFGIQTAVGSLAWFLSPLMATRVSIAGSIESVFLLFAIMLGVTWAVSASVNIRNRIALRK